MRLTRRSGGRWFVCGALALALIGSTAEARTIYVNAANQSGDEDGTLLNPYNRIQRGINAAVASDVVSVAGGTYFESVAMKNGVSVIGAGASSTIIDAAGQENSAVTFNGTTGSPRLSGFTITNGAGDQIGSLAGTPIVVGGGILIRDSSPLIRDNVITGNDVSRGICRGGGIYISASTGIGFVAQPQIIGNVISNNIAVSPDEPEDGFGGGIYVEGKSSLPIISENIIESNAASQGGGIYVGLTGAASGSILRNTIRFNQATSGAAIYARSFDTSNAAIANNVIEGNTILGGRVDCDDSDPDSSPNLPEICNDGIDNDCDPSTPDLFDMDGDGYSCDVDCDDSNPLINPGMAEHCADEIDNDCDGAIDFSNPDNIVLVQAGTPMRYRANTTDPGIALTWVAGGFNDTAWTVGTYGVGFENVLPGAIDLLETPIPGNSASVYTRTVVPLDETANINAVFVSADWDDGYVVWINGTEVYRSPQMPGGNPVWNSNPTSHESSNGVVPVYGAPIDITTAALPLLQVGNNVVAIGGYTNLPGSSSDLVLVPRLSLSVGPNDLDCLCPDLDGDSYHCSDCDDSNPNINPGMAEICNNGIDDDCNPATTDIFDADGDGYNCTVDCDSSNPAVNPGAVEVHCDGLDNDCNPGTPDVVDLDSDNFDCLSDCDDLNPAINPDRIEFCFDNMDNNCDGFIDEMDAECICDNPVDVDGDGYRCRDCNDGNPSINPGAPEICDDGIDNDCTATTPDIFDNDDDGYDCTVDCRDFDPESNPGAFEICDDGIDNDCNGQIDGADTACACPDLDGDGYACTDCNDGNPNINPGMTEVCNNGIDDDCNPATPDDFDADGDGFGCTLDCDDNDAAINPDSAEQCTDLRDNDCDGWIDVLRSDLALVQFGSPARILANSSNPGIGLNWTQRFFDDAGWSNALYGVGYEVGGGGANDLIITDVPNLTLSVYSRANFTIPDVAGVNALYIAADYDDGWVAWINGVEVYRSPEMPAGPPAWNANAALHESSNGVVPNYGPPIDITTVGAAALVNGTNVLAVGVYNNGAGPSTDLVVVPRLAMDYGADDPDCVCPDHDQDGYLCNDCNDTDPAINPGAAEIGCDGIDNDCDPATLDVFDADGDGFACDVDCNDLDPDVNPSATEIGCDFTDNDCNAMTPDIRDDDSDTYTCVTDCNDNDANVNPGISEIHCDGIDNDCSTLTADVVDADSDGFFCDVDCDDTDPDVNPLAVERCDDGIDNDCNGDVDGADAECICGDGDGDGYSCSDCNDANPMIHPGMPEVCNDGIDNDCDAQTPDIFDSDGDGFDCLTDCDDTNPFVRPNAAEICDDGIDNDCNPLTLDLFDVDGDGYTCEVDCAENEPTVNPGAVEICNDGIDNDCNPGTPDIFDGDSDGYNCSIDCNDGNVGVNPGAIEICNDGIDNDCNPLTPDLFDADGDGALCNVDCDDNNPLRASGFAEKCNDGIDNDCNAMIDGADPACACPDLDGDAYACADCNDTNPNVNPGMLEVCNNGIDDDCNPSTLDIDDLDGDGYFCSADCDDFDPTINPGAVEVCGDGRDNDCNAGTPDIFDADGDTFACDVDCDDSRSDVNPSMVEIGCDGIDNDCNPSTPDLADADGDLFGCADLTTRGAGVYLYLFGGGTASIVNNTIVSNSVALGVGGGLSLDDLDSSNPGVVANNIVFDNSAFLGGGIDHSVFFGELLTNNVFANSGGDLYDSGGSGATKEGNLSTEPLFFSAVTGNYRLRPESPLIDSSDPTSAPLNDLDRFARPFDGDGDGVAIADLGAFEYPSGEVFELEFGALHALTWEVRPGDLSFNVYRGNLIVLKQGGGDYTQNPLLALPDRFCGIAGNSLPFVDPYVPPSGRTVYYLVTLVTPALEGSLGQDSEGRLRPNYEACP